MVCHIRNTRGKRKKSQRRKEIVVENFQKNNEKYQITDPRISEKSMENKCKNEKKTGHIIFKDLKTKIKRNIFKWLDKRHIIYIKAKIRITAYF